ncbi:MAG: TIGR04255 family protein [Lysobacterales bacterium]
MGKRLSKAPVCFTLAQMRFNPVLVMEPILPDLQEAFRGAGFPDYSATTVQSLEVSSSEAGMAVREQTISRYVFRNKTQTAAFLLDPSALTYELTDYPVFEEFSDTFSNALEIVHRQRPIEYRDRLGMRMLDAVQPLDGESLEQYLVPQALGLINLVGDTLDHQQTLTESLFKRGSRTLRVRTLHADHEVAVPPDLAPFRLKLAKRFLAHTGETVMLDSDSFDAERVDFMVQATRAELAELKAALSQCFKALVTPHALKTWE